MGIKFLIRLAIFSMIAMLFEALYNIAVDNQAQTPILYNVICILYALIALIIVIVSLVWRGLLYFLAIISQNDSLISKTSKNWNSRLNHFILGIQVLFLHIPLLFEAIVLAPLSIVKNLISTPLREVLPPEYVDASDSLNSVITEFEDSCKISTDSIVDKYFDKNITVGTDPIKVDINLASTIKSHTSNHDIAVLEWTGIKELWTSLKSVLMILASIPDIDFIDFIFEKIDENFDKIMKNIFSGYEFDGHDYFWQKALGREPPGDSSEEIIPGVENPSKPEDAVNGDFNDE